MNRPPRSFWQIWNLSFGFLGIQFGWGLQMANMSAIYEYLGARADQIPILWLAAPLTGLIIQPLVGRASDRTWCRLGRRRPYFLAGALFSSAALILMPHSGTLWMAAGLLWVLDGCINISMMPYRAFVTDLLPPEQNTRGFAMQSLFIGLGAVLASFLPLIMIDVFHVNGTAAAGVIPFTVRFSFYVGAAAFMGAVLWTIFTTPEYPPDDLEAFRKEKKRDAGFGATIAEIGWDIANMPRTMRQLAWVQLANWLGLYCMWLYFPVAVARNVFGATDTTSTLYAQGEAWGGACFGVYSAVCFIFAFALPPLAAKMGRKVVHSISLLAGALGLLSVAVIHSKYMLLLSMTGVGISWASTLSMPFAMLADSLPEGKNGVYMGIFNLFIVAPEIVASLGFGWVMVHLLHEDRLAAVVAGGVFFIVAAVLTLRVDDAGDVRSAAERKAPQAVAVH